MNEVQRLRDKFIDLQIRQESRTASYWKTIDEGLEQIEVILENRRRSSVGDF